MENLRTEYIKSLQDSKEKLTRAMLLIEEQIAIAGNNDLTWDEALHQCMKVGNQRIENILNNEEG